MFLVSGKEFLPALYLYPTLAYGPRAGVSSSYPGLLVLLVELGHIKIIQVDQQALFTHLTGLHGAKICSLN